MHQGRPHLDLCADTRPWGSTAPPRAAYFFSVDHRGEHLQRHLAGFSGILQVDAHSGLKAFYTLGTSGKLRIRGAARSAHLRRDFFDVHTATKSETARAALGRIADHYDIERQINGQSRDALRAVRQTETRPKSEALKAWSEFQLTRFPSNSDHAKPLLYTLNRWNAFTLCLADIFARNHHHKTNRLDVLPPWNWKPFANQAAAA